MPATSVSSRSDSTHPRRVDRALIWILAAGAVLRLVILVGTADLQLHIVDEQHYAALAGNLTHSGVFAMTPGQPTSMRPPLYPAFIAGLWRLAGQESLQLVRAAQIALSLASVVLLYRIGTQLLDRRAAVLAAAGLCFYPSLLIGNYLLLTETLFTFLLLVFIHGYIALLRRPRTLVALATGGALALAALTRSVLWPFPILLAPWTYLSLTGTRMARLATVGFLLIGYVAVVAPWAIRNTRLQKVLTIVDTMGGSNLRTGNYEHTPDDRMWDAVSLEGSQNWASALREAHPGVTFTEGEKDKWAQGMALSYMWHHPLITLRRSAIKFADFWGLEREYAAGLQQGIFRPPKVIAVFAVVAIGIVYPLMMSAAVFGLCLARPADVRIHRLLLLIVLFVCALHVLAFGHSRYHLPLVPILLLYAGSAWVDRSWRRLGGDFRMIGVPVAGVLVLAAIWIRQLAFTDFSRVAALLQSLG